MGGLGNQMFQYAYAKSLLHLGYNVKIDINSFYEGQPKKSKKLAKRKYQLNFYNITIPIATETDIHEFYKKFFFHKLLKKRKYRVYPKDSFIEKTLSFDKQFMHPPQHSYIIGYFQNENYFKQIKSVILNNFSIKGKLSHYSKTVEQQIIQSPTSCSLHIRRGDFLTAKSSDIRYHELCSLDYYYKAIDIIKNKNGNTKFFIFSDDLDWVKRNLKIANSIFVSSNYERIPHEDIFLMSQCNHNIIANSSFSWWGGYLNKYQNKIVIAPENWLTNKEENAQIKNIICSNWLRLEN